MGQYHIVLYFSLEYQVIDNRERWSVTIPEVLHISQLTSYIYPNSLKLVRIFSEKHFKSLSTNICIVQCTYNIHIRKVHRVWLLYLRKKISILVHKIQIPIVKKQDCIVLRIYIFQNFHNLRCAKLT